MGSGVAQLVRAPVSDGKVAGYRFESRTEQCIVASLGKTMLFSWLARSELWDHAVYPSR